MTTHTLFHFSANVPSVKQHILDKEYKTNTKYFKLVHGKLKFKNKIPEAVWDDALGYTGPIIYGRYL